MYGSLISRRLFRTYSNKLTRLDGRFVAQCSMELHFALRIAVCARVKQRQGDFDMMATFRHHRQVDPQRYGGHGERHTNGYIALR